MWKGVERCGRIWKDVEGCRRLWNVREYSRVFHSSVVNTFTYDKYTLYLFYPHVLGSFRHVFSILISFLTLFSFLFVIRTKSKALRKYEVKK